MVINLNLLQSISDILDKTEELQKNLEEIRKEEIDLYYSILKDHLCIFLLNPI